MPSTVASGFTSSRHEQPNFYITTETIYRQSGERARVGRQPPPVSWSWPARTRGRFASLPDVAASMYESAVVITDRKTTRSSATAELARDADDVDFSVDDVYSLHTCFLDIFGDYR